MPRCFSYSYRRYYGDLRDDFIESIYARDTIEALLLIVADLKGLYAVTPHESCQRAREFLDDMLGAGWGFEDFTHSDVPLWADHSLCYRVNDILEVSVRN